MLVTVQVTIAVIVPLRTSPVYITVVTRRWIPLIGTIYEASGLVQAADGTLVLARIPIH